MDCGEVICEPNASFETSAPSSVISRIWVRASVVLELMVICSPICVASVRVAGEISMAITRVPKAFSIMMAN